MSIFGSPYTETSVRSGTAYRLSILRQTLLATNIFKVAVVNPVGSGYNMVFQGTTIDSYASALSSLSVFRGPTGGLPATAITTTPGALGVIAPLNTTTPMRQPVITVAAGSYLATAPFTGGAQTQNKPIYTNMPTKSDETIAIFAPGTVIGFSFGNGLAADFSFNLLWSEEAI